MPPASPLSLHATTVEVEVMVMVLVMVMVAVTVSPVPVVVTVVTADVVSSLLPQPCKDREATKPKQMAANARASCMITMGSCAGVRTRCCSAFQASSLFSLNSHSTNWVTGAAQSSDP